MTTRLKITQWNAKQILAKGPRILKDYSVVLGAQLQEEMLTEQFYWPVDTKRKSGAFIKKGNRDIYDTGELIQSQSESVSGDTLTIRYSAPYALEVLTGKGQAGPARDWVTPAQEAKPLLPFVIERWNKSNK